MCAYVQNVFLAQEQHDHDPHIDSLYAADGPWDSFLGESLLCLH